MNPADTDVAQRLAAFGQSARVQRVRTRAQAGRLVGERAIGSPHLDIDVGAAKLIEVRGNVDSLQLRAESAGPDDLVGCGGEAQINLAREAGCENAVHRHAEEEDDARQDGGIPERETQTQGHRSRGGMNVDLREPEADGMKTGPGVNVTGELEQALNRV